MSAFWRITSCIGSYHFLYLRCVFAKNHLHHEFTCEEPQLPLKNFMSPLLQGKTSHLLRVHNNGKAIQKSGHSRSYDIAGDRVPCRFRSVQWRCLRSALPAWWAPGHARGQPCWSPKDANVRQIHGRRREYVPRLCNTYKGESVCWILLALLARICVSRWGRHHFRYWLVTHWSIGKSSWKHRLTHWMSDHHCLIVTMGKMVPIKKLDYQRRHRYMTFTQHWLQRDYRDPMVHELHIPTLQSWGNSSGWGCLLSGPDVTSQDCAHHLCCNRTGTTSKLKRMREKCQKNHVFTFNAMLCELKTIARWIQKAMHDQNLDIFKRAAKWHLKIH